MIKLAIKPVSQSNRMKKAIARLTDYDLSKKDLNLLFYASESIGGEVPIDIDQKQERIIRKILVSAQTRASINESEEIIRLLENGGQVVVSYGVMSKKPSRIIWKSLPRISISPSNKKSIVHDDFKK